MNVFKVIEKVYNLRNLHALYSNNKKTVKIGTQTKAVRGPKTWNMEVVRKRRNNSEKQPCSTNHTV